jgi:DNA primase catalytic subunit
MSGRHSPEEPFNVRKVFNRLRVIEQKEIERIDQHIRQFEKELNRQLDALKMVVENDFFLIDIGKSLDGSTIRIVLNRLRDLGFEVTYNSTLDCVQLDLVTSFKNNIK